MNERIQELAEQAEKYADDNFKGEPTWSEAFESKFAELIIDECCLKLLDMDEKTKGAHNYYKHAAIQIKQHFGG
jgi:hypothetical protein